MTDGARPHLVLGCGIALLGALVVVLLVTFEERDGGQGSGRGAARSGDAWFTISGHATEPITPRVHAAIDLKFGNPHPIPLAVTDVQVSVRAVNAPQADHAHPCTAGDFAVEQMPRDKEITIPAGETRTLSGLGLPRASWPRVGLVDRPVNQDGCKEATLVLAYTASGSIGW